MKNLIEQLKQTPKWSEFEQWWNDNYKLEIFIHAPAYEPYNGVTIKREYLSFFRFLSFPFEFQEGIFKKFIESQNKWNYVFVCFNDEKCKKTKDYIGNQHDVAWNFYYTNVDNAQSDFELDLYFNTFEELIIWYFNR